MADRRKSDAPVQLDSMGDSDLARDCDHRRCRPRSHPARGAGASGSHHGDRRGRGGARGTRSSRGNPQRIVSVVASRPAMPESEPPYRLVRRGGSDYREDEGHHRMQITLSVSQSIVRAAMKKAESLGALVSVAVVDSGGHLVAFGRMDGAEIAGPTLAVDKAYTSVSNRIS